MSFEDWTGEEIESLNLDLTLKRPSPNHSIFKYIGLNTKTSWDYLERTLNKFELVGSTWNALNDPFEISPYLFNDLRPEIIGAVVGRPSIADRLTGQEWNPETAFADTAPFEVEARKSFSKIQSDARIISFCDRSDSPLLWSHYAHSYAGACLHFAGRAFTRFRTKMGFVCYSEHRPTYPLSLALQLSRGRSRNGLSRAESDKLAFYTKAADWSYEREARIVYNASHETSVTFSPSGLLSIISGPRMKDADRVRLTELVQQSRLNHLPIRSASLSTNSFSVEID